MKSIGRSNLMIHRSYDLYRSVSILAIVSLGVALNSLPAYAQCAPVTATSATCDDSSGTPAGLEFSSSTGFSFVGGSSLDVVRTDGENWDAIRIAGGGSATLQVTLEDGAHVSASGFRADGVEVSTSENDTIILVSAADIEIFATEPVILGTGTSGLFGWNQNVASTATITITQSLDGRIEADGREGMGIYGLQRGSGTVTLRNDGQIVTHGAGGWGMNAWIVNSDGTGDTTITLGDTGTIISDGQEGVGIYSLNNGLGGAYIFSDGVVETSGLYADGLIATIDNGVSTSNAEIHIAESSSVTTLGATSYGAWSLTRGLGTALIINDGTVLVEGASSAGLFGSAEGDGNVDIQHIASVSATGELGIGIRGGSEGGSVLVTVADTATVLGGWEAAPVGGTYGAAAVSVNAETGSTIENFGTISAGSDRAIVDEGRWGAVGTGAVEIRNHNSITGYLELAARPGNSFTNFDGAELMLRHLADIDGDGARDIKRVSISDFGDVDSIFSNQAGAIVALESVPAGVAFDAVGYYTPTTGAGSIPLSGDAFYDFARDQVVQAQMVNLGAFSNAGVIDLRGAVTGNTLVITGNPTAGGGAGTGTFRSDGGQLLLNTVLGAGVVAGGGSGSQSDVLIVDGTELGVGGPTLISIGRREGTGALTVDNGILLVEVRDMARSAADVFALDGDFVLDGQQRIMAGAWSYGLYHNGIAADAADGNWYLRNVGVAPTVPVYVEYPEMLRPLIDVPTLRERVGNRTSRTAPAAPKPVETIFCKDASRNFRCLVTPEQDAYYADSEPAFATIEKGGFWGRIEASSTTSDTVDTAHWGMQIGADRVLSEGDKGVLVGGLSLNYGTLSATIDAPFGRGNIDASGYGVGANLTWYGHTGLYVDGQLKASWLESDFASTTLASSLASDVKSNGYAASVEVGHAFRVHNHWSLTPQAQLVWSGLETSSFTDSFGNTVVTDNADVLRGRIGLAAEYQRSWQTASGLSHSSFYGIVNLHDTLPGSPTIQVANVAFDSRSNDREIGLGLGGERSWSDDRYSIYGQASFRTGIESFGDSVTASGTLGLRLRW